MSGMMGGMDMPEFPKFDEAEIRRQLEPKTEAELEQILEQCKQQSAAGGNTSEFLSKGFEAGFGGIEDPPKNQTFQEED